MKKTILSLVALMTVANIHAQVVEVYEGNNTTTPTKIYTSTTSNPVKVVFKEVGETGTIDNHEYVKIGNLLWATMNVGATTVADSYDTAIGDYYAWGETVPYYQSKTITDIDPVSGTTGNFGEGNKPTFSTENEVAAHVKGVKSSYNWANYCGESSFTEWSEAPYDETTKALKPKNDVAHVEWGGSWRMPTAKEYQSLITACTGSTSKQDWKTVPEDGTITEKGIYYVAKNATVDGVEYKIAGALFVADVTDKSKRVFFPFAGRIKNTAFGDAHYVHYWSSTLAGVEQSGSYLRGSYKSNDGFTVTAKERYVGQPVRAVIELPSTAE